MNQTKFVKMLKDFGVIKVSTSKIDEAPLVIGCGCEPYGGHEEVQRKGYDELALDPDFRRTRERMMVEVAKAEAWKSEREDVLSRFHEELAKATGDGSKKRQAGEKPPWYEDDSHEGAIFSHITKWKRGELVDDSSGAHPLVHAAWRCLAIALKETGNVPD